MFRSFFIIVFLAVISFDNGTASWFLCNKSEDLQKTFHLGNDQIKFYVYIRGTVNSTRVVCNKNCDLNKYPTLQFNPNLKTTVITHGFMSNYQTNWIQSLIQKLFLHEDMNIIVVDWSGFIGLNYYRTAEKTVVIASQIYKLLVHLAVKSNVDLSYWPYIHFIGHSMGAHVVGQAAEMLKQKVFVHRITALDPARPYFHKDGANLKLNKTNAQFVDVIHTNSAPNEETFGLYEPLGHIDFYPNGGDKQLGCNLNNKKDKASSPRKQQSRLIIDPLKCLLKLDFGVDLIALKKNYLGRKLLGDDMLCDHREAQTYFINSITGKSTFIAQKWDNNPNNTFTNCAAADCTGYGCVEMGMNAFRYSDSYYHGLYYVNTARSA